MRPSVHFTAPTGWVNDPHGVTFHNGVYHLFHQYVPGTMTWAPNCHWGHTTSPDLLSWGHHTVALAPGDGDDGIWTGSLIAEDSAARILYTSVKQPNLGIGRIRVARALDDHWDQWQKGDVVAEPPAEEDLIAYRDPFVIRQDDGWRMFVGAANRTGDALALTYTSSDLESWVYDGVAVSRSTHETEPVWMGALWECPQIFEVDCHWVMVSSVWDDDILHYAGYAIGDSTSFDGRRFVPTDWGQLSFGGSYYAPSFFRDRDGRPCLMFWMRGVTDDVEGWASCLSVPYLLSVRDGRLVAEPHPEVSAARGESVEPNSVRGVIDAEWTPARGVDHMILTSDEGKTVRLSTEDGRVVLERPGQEPWSMPWSGGRLRVLVDGPVLEVSCTDGILGGPIDPGTHLVAPNGEFSAWSLAPPRSA